MEHLLIEEIIDFVTFDEINNETLENSQKVNAHIIRCSECMRKVRAFQTVYDKLEQHGKNADLKDLTLEESELDEWLDIVKSKTDKSGKKKQTGSNLN